MITKYDLFQKEKINECYRHVGSVCFDTTTLERPCLQLDNYHLPIYLDNIIKFNQFVGDIFFKFMGLVTTGSYNPASQDNKNSDLVISFQISNPLHTENNSMEIMIQHISQAGFQYRTSVSCVKKTFPLTQYQLGILKENGRVFVLEDYHPFGLGTQRVLLVYKEKECMLDFIIDRPDYQVTFYTEKDVFENFISVLKRERDCDVILKLANIAKVNPVPVIVSNIADHNYLLSLGNVITNVPYGVVKEVGVDIDENGGSLK